MGRMKIQQMGEGRPGGGEGLPLYLSEEEGTFHGILGLQGRGGRGRLVLTRVPLC